MTFEKYAALLSFISGIVSIVFSISRFCNNPKEYKLSGVGVFVGIVLLATGFMLMYNEGYLCSGSNGGVSSEYDESHEIPSSDPSSTDTYDEEEEIKERAKRVSYIDFYPDHIGYTHSRINIWKKSDGNVLNIRSGPGTKYTKLGQIKNGEEVITLCANYSDYAYIYDPDSEKYGWVMSRYVE